LEFWIISFIFAPKITKDKLLWRMFPADPGSEPRIPMEKLQKAFPSYEWTKGHSGALLPEDIIDEIDELWEKELEM
jgi:hypothetical protein